MKLKKEVKEGLVCIGLLFIGIILLLIVSKNSEKAYNECLIENNNDVNLCYKLVE